MGILLRTAACRGVTVPPPSRCRRQGRASMADAAGSSPALLEPVNTPSPENTSARPGLSRRGAGGIGRQVAHRLLASFLQFGGDGFLSPRRRGVSRPGPASATGEPVPAAVSPWLRGGGGRVQCAWSRRCLSPVTARRLLRRVGEARADHVRLQPGKSPDRLSEPGRRPGELPDIDLESSYTGPCKRATRAK
jgi:hypothetical protein